MKTRALVWCVALVVAAAPARSAAADLDELLPPESNLVVSFNFEQLLDSPLARKYLPELVKKYGFDFFADMAEENETAAAAFKGNADNIRKVLEDPKETLKWADALKGSYKRATVAVKTDSGDGEPELMILEGNWDASLLDGMFTFAALTTPEDVKVIKGKDRKYYKLLPKDGTELFGALLGNEMGLMTMREDALLRAMDVSDGKKVERKASKKLRDLVRKADADAAVSVCWVDDEKKMSVSGSLSIGKDATLKVRIVADDEEAAKAVEEEAEGLRKAVDDEVGGYAKFADAFKPIQKAVGAVTIVRTEREVAIDGKLSGEAIAALMKKLLED